MLNSKILCKEISPDISNRRLTPAGELVIVVTSAQNHGYRETKPSITEISLTSRDLGQGWPGWPRLQNEGLHRLPQPVLFVDSRLAISDTKSIFSGYCCKLELFLFVSFPFSCPIMLSLENIHYVFYSWIAEEVGDLRNFRRRRNRWILHILQTYEPSCRIPST